MEVGRRSCSKVMTCYRFGVVRNHVSDRLIDRCATHVWTLSIAMQNRQDIPAISIHLLQLAQQTHGLLGKRHDVLSSRFNFLWRDAPFRSPQVDFFPSRATKFDRSREQHHQQSNRNGSSSALVGRQLPKESLQFFAAQCSGILCRGFQDRSAQHRSRIRICPKRDHRILEHVGHVLAQLDRHGRGATFFNPAHQSKHIVSGNRANGAASDVWVCIGFEHAQNFAKVLLSPSLPLLLQPLITDGPESCFAFVDARRQHFLPCV